MSSAAAISRATCQHHPQREAAARCVSCGQPYCRECVTALERRMYCASCFQQKTGVRQVQKRDWFLLNAGLQLLLGLLVLWVGAYMLGKLLLSVPAGFHEGKVWERVATGED